ncbi:MULTISPECIES: GAF domain-containing protein [Cyanophyceae]|uniref:GAF domain-containing protein n=1 Tax=Cyanophyceae TaxID=3028117 RepID=UPI0016825766|nr:GAF domain-containing protein [Trichocoleus sp. FACHB-40]MBD2005948.1 GAF domain-containing protein [Trichocoleus sp. FACHB-40]
MHQPSDPQPNTTKVTTNGRGRLNGRKVTAKHQDPIPLKLTATQQEFNESQSLEQNADNWVRDGLEQKKQEKPSQQPQKLSLPKSSTLRSQLLTTILPVVLAPLAIAGAAFWAINNYQAARSTDSKLWNDAMLSSDLAGSKVKDAFTVPSSLAENPLIINAARAATKPTQTVQPNQLTPSQAKVNLAVPKPPQPSPTLNYYLQATAKKQNFPELLFTDQNGLVVASAAPVENTVQRGNEWWQKAKSEGQWISEFKLEQGRNPSIELSNAIKDPNSGEFLGVIKSVMTAANFDDLAVPLKHIGLSASEKIQILAPASKAVISTITPNGTIGNAELLGGEPIFQKATALLEELKAQKAVFGEKPSLGRKPSYFTTRDKLQGLTIIPFVHEQGQLVLSTSFNHDDRKYTLAVVPGIDLVSVTSIDLSEIGAAGNEHALIFVLIFLTLGAVGTGIVVSLARRWSAPLKELTGTSEQLAAGNLDAYVEPRGTAETQTLALSFNNLVARVKDLLRKQEFEAKRAKLFAEIATSARESLDVKEVFEKAVTGAQQILNAERMFLYRFNPDWSGNVVAEAVAPSWPSCLNKVVNDTYFTQSDVGVELYRNGRVFVIDNIYKANLNPCHIRLYEEFGIKANIITPIVSGDKLLGLMCTQQCSSPRNWQQYEVDFCTQLSTQVGLALDRISYLEKKEAEAKQQEVEAKRIQLCADIATSARETLDVKEVFQKAVTGAQQILNVERVFLYRFNADWSGDIVAEAVALGWPSCLKMQVSDTYFTDSNVGVERYRNGRIFVIDDIYKANLTDCHVELYERLKIKANIITPLVSGDKLLGLMCTQQCSSSRNWQQYEVDFCTQLSTQVGLALDRINFLKQKEAEAKQQEVEAKRIQLCADIATSARETLDVKEVFEKAVTGAQQILNAERVFLYRFNPDWSGIVVAEAVMPGLPSCLQIKVTDTYFTDSNVGVELYRNGRVFVIDDIYKGKLTPCHIELYERLKIKANVITPVVSGDKLLGLMCTQQCSSARNWQQYELDFCTQLSTQVGLALDRITFLEQKEFEAKQQEVEAKRIQLCADIATSARETLDVKEVFAKAVTGAQQILNAERVFLYRFNPDWSGDVVAEAMISELPTCMNLTVTDTYFTDSQVGIERYRKGRVFVINDIYQANLTGCHIELYERLKIKANVITPIVSGDKLLGLMCTQQCSTSRNWQQYEVDFCTQLSTQVGLALDRINFLKQKEAEAKQREVEAKLTQLFADIANSARESLNVQEVFDKAVVGAQQILNAERVFLYRFNPDWSGIVVAEAMMPGLPSCMNIKVADTYFTDSQEGVELYRQGRVFVIDDIYQSNLTPCHIELYERLKIKANAIAPIVSGDKLLGLMCVQQCSSPRVWQQSEVAICTQLATQVGLAIDRIGYLEQKEAEAKRSQLLSNITLRIRESLKLEDILSTTVEEVRHAFNTERLIVYRFDANWDGTVIAESVETGWMPTQGVKIEDTCLKETSGGSYNKGRIRAIDDIYQAGLNDCHIKMLERLQVKASLVAPIMLDNELFGLIIAHQCSKTRTWQKGEIDLFMQLATQVGLALNQATLVEQIQTLLAAQQEATRQQAENAQQQRLAKEALQKRALELLLEVDPVSKGDLTIRAQVTEDEIGTIADSYNATISSLRKIVNQVQTAAKQVTATTSSNEVSVQELSAEALRQTEEILAALDRIQEMSSSIRAVAANAEQAEAAVQQATQIVKEGDAAMNRTVNGILAIRETVAETSKKVKRLGESSQKISKVVNLIGTFAAQTNLLALNASIEAARAGEEGRGFAVVADEVRSLARQSAAATAEIEKLVAGIQAETNEVVAAMESGTEQVVTGTKLVDEARQNLNKITAASVQISALVEAIAQAAAVQSKASDEVTQTMSNVAAIANKTSTGATEVSASFKELLALAQELQANVGKFKVQ